MSTIPLDLETDEVILPPPELPARLTLEQALKARRSARDVLPDTLPPATGCAGADRGSAAAMTWGKPR